MISQRKKRIICWLWIALWSFSPIAVGVGGGPEARLRKLLNKSVNKKTAFSIHFRDPTNDRTVFGHRADTSLIPASNMKLITSAAALDQLGSDFVYETQFALWRDNLVVIAGGDPLTGDPILAQQRGKDIFDLFGPLLEQLRKCGISTIKGDMLIDDTIFDDIRFHPSWPVEQSNKWYTAQISALNFNNNCVDFNITPAPSAKALVSYRLTPQTCYIKVANKCTTIKKGPNTSWAARAIGTNSVTLRGTCRAAQTINVTVERPSAYFGMVLAEYLLNNGVRINGKLVIKSLRDASGHLPKDMKTLYLHKTVIRDILGECNRRSLNMVAECLFKTIGAYHTQSGGDAIQQGSWQSGREAVTAFLDKLHIDSAMYEIDDGCGLSHRNRLSARCITNVLSFMFRHKHADLYRNSLATPDDGTLKRRKRFRESTYRSRIFAKTGYVNSVRCLSGYAKTKSGRWLAFSILTNRPPASSQTIDRIVKEMIN